MKFKIPIFIILFLAFFFLFVGSVFAVDYIPLVPCGLNQKPAGGDPTIDYTRPCTTCDTFRLAKNVIDLILLGLVPPVAAVLFIYGGLVILLAGARPSWISHGKTVFWTTFWGLVIILASWLIANTFIKSFAPGQLTDAPWYRLECPLTLGGPPPPPPPPPDLCSQPQLLAEQNNTVYPAQNAPELNQLISCISSNLSGQNLGSIYTYDVNDNDAPNSYLCNFTRGVETCGGCSHLVNSCHYGGSSGNQGALAVDFGNENIGDMIIGVAVQQCGAKNGRCEDSNSNFVGCTNPSATHVHINSKSCDRN